MALNLSFDALAPDYAHLWETATLLPSRKAAADATAAKIIANMDRYKKVEAATSVPAVIVGIIHAMECGLNFSKHLHNGDPLTRRTTHVPAGRPKTGSPPFTWEESAIDALTMEGLNKVGAWTPEVFCYQLEKYNGTGYRRLKTPINSPYLWSGTNQYSRGKYVSDGRYDPNAVSGQSGAVAILMCAMARDKTVATLFEKPATLVADAGTPDKQGMLAMPPEMPPVTPPSTQELATDSTKAWILLKVRNWLGTLGIGGGTATVDSLLQPDGPTNNFLTIIEKHPVSVLAVGSIILAGAGLVAYVLLEYMKKDVVNGRYYPSGWTQDT